MYLTLSWVESGITDRAKLQVALIGAIRENFLVEMKSFHIFLLQLTAKLISEKLYLIEL